MKSVSTRQITTCFVFAVLALLGLGIVMLYSSSSTDVGSKYMLQQLVGCSIGLVLCVILAFSDYRLLKKYYLWFLVISVLLLACVFVPQLSRGVIKGARRWIQFKGMRFQPSEFAKFALVIFLAWYCERNIRFMSQFRRGVVFPGAVIVVFLGLIYFEPDRGCAILLAAVCGCMLVIAGVKFWYYAPVILAGIALVAYSVMTDPVRSKRIMSWWNPDQYRLDGGWQAYQAMIALGSGGWWGLGLGNGRQKLGFVPDHHTDFIYSIIGEELGLIATLLVLFIFIVLIFCAMSISRRARDNFGMFLGSGITFLIGFQAFINIGVVTSALPCKGMPLPFISYGPSNMVMLFVGVGLLLSISRFAEEPASQTEAVEEINAPELSDV
jgi:cell division protein FtsW